MTKKTEEEIKDPVELARKAQADAVAAQEERDKIVPYPTPDVIHEVLLKGQPLEDGSELDANADSEEGEGAEGGEGKTPAPAPTAPQTPAPAPAATGRGKTTADKA